MLSWIILQAARLYHSLGLELFENLRQVVGLIFACLSLDRYFLFEQLFGLILDHKGLPEVLLRRLLSCKGFFFRQLSRAICLGFHVSLLKLLLELVRVS